MKPTDYLALFKDDRLAKYGAGLATPREAGEIEGAMVQFTPETAHYWAGPFPGNYAAMIVRDYGLDPKARLISRAEYQRRRFEDMKQYARKNRRKTPIRSQ
jgi:hypothetical protein